MATVTTSIGTRSAENVDITNATGAGPYTVTLNSATTTTDNGDTLTDEHATPRSYRITAGAGTTSLTVVDDTGVGSAPDFSGTTQATTKRTFSTITLWEANLDDTNRYAASDDAVGEMYNDATFDETVTVNGGGTRGLNSVKLTVPEAERHDGTAGNGARVVRTGADFMTVPVPSGFDEKYTFEWFEVNMNGQNGTCFSTSGATFGNIPIFSNIIGHDQSGGDAFLGFVDADDRDARVQNCIFYDNTRNTSLELVGIALDGDQAGGGVFNTTVYNCNNTGSGDSTGVKILTNSANAAVKNTISMGTTASSGTPKDFSYAGTSIDDDYNMSSDDTADDGGGANSLISKTTGNQFVSTTGGSEDLHLKAGADAIDVGTDLATTPTNVNIDINGSDRNAFTSTLWSIGAHNYEIKASIGTSSRDYSTMTAWEAALATTSTWGKGENAVGECYADSNFDEVCTINDSNPGNIRLTVASGERHDGTAGTGVRMVASATNSSSISAQVANVYIEWIEIDGNGKRIDSVVANGALGSEGAEWGARRLIIHDVVGTFNPQPINNTGQGKGYIINNIIYDINSSGGSVFGITANRSAARHIQNNTIHNVSGSAGATTALGIDTNDTAGIIVQNNIVTDTLGASTTNKDYDVTAPANATYSYNLSSDTTASGTGSLTSKTSANQFENTTGGSEDLHLKAGADAIDAGRGVIGVTDVDIDIDGTTRRTARIFYDTFTEASDVEVSTHTPDVGDGWTKVIGYVANVSDTGSGSDIGIESTDNTFKDSSAATNGLASDGAIYSADATYDVANYTVQVDMAELSIGTDDPIWIAARMTDANNLYALKLMDQDGTATCNLFKRVSGTWSAIGTAKNPPADGSVVTLEVRGSTISWYDDGVLIDSVTDTALTSAGEAGLGAGMVGETSNEDMIAFTLDNFTVYQAWDMGADQRVAVAGGGIRSMRQLVGHGQGTRD